MALTWWIARGEKSGSVGGRGTKGDRMEFSKEATEIRRMLARERNGVLSTISVKEAGWPFGSITPYTRLESGEPVILISEIAEHTRNVRHDARVSLLVQESAAIGKPQAGARVTIMGYAIPMPPPYVDHASRLYTSVFPDSADYFLAHDFSLYTIVAIQIRYIGGFGDIHWLPGGALLDYAAASEIDPLAAQIDGVCKHMNEDHADSLELMAERLAGTRAQSARMIRVDSRGFDVIAAQDGTHKYVRLAFPEAVSNSDQTRRAMVTLVQRARSLPQENK
jgi:putative heme iron utilization protein